jgi:hypothetical protein
MEVQKQGYDVQILVDAIGDLPIPAACPATARASGVAPRPGRQRPVALTIAAATTKESPRKGAFPCAYTLACLVDARITPTRREDIVAGGRNRDTDLLVARDAPGDGCEGRRCAAPVHSR